MCPFVSLPRRNGWLLLLEKAKAEKNQTSRHLKPSCSVKMPGIIFICSLYICPSPHSLAIHLF
jgi:hypothetical protein